MSTSNPTQRHFAHHRNPCWTFQRKGTCKKGLQCRFRHDAVVAPSREGHANPDLSSITNVTGEANLELPTIQLGWDISAALLEASSSSTNLGTITPPEVGQRAQESERVTTTLPNEISQISIQDDLIPEPQPTIRYIICRNWTRGHCKYGGRCKYHHGDPQDVPQHSTSNKTTGGSNNASGSRRRGQRDGASSVNLQEAARRAEDKRREEEQRKKLAEEERLRREEEEKERTALEEKEKREREERGRIEAAKQQDETQRSQEALARRRFLDRLARETHVVEQSVVLDTSLITIGAGFSIKSVVCGFDVCRIRIKNLPLDSTKREIAELFIKYGIDPYRFFLVSSRTSGRYQEAVVLTAAEDGQSIASELENVELRDHKLAFDIAESTGWNSMDARGGKNKLTIIWYPRSEAVIATYATPGEADKMFAHLDGKTIEGQRFKCFRNPHPRSQYDGYSFEQASSSIKVIGFSKGSCENGRAARTCRTSLVTLEPQRGPAPMWTNESTFLRLRQMLSARPGVRMDTYRVVNDNESLGPLKIDVAFSSWDEAKATFDSIPSFHFDRALPKLKAFLQEPVEYAMRIPHHQYEAQASQWQDLTNRPPTSSRPGDPHVTVKRGERDVFLRVDGKNQKAVGELKVRVEKLVAGERLDNSFWNRFWLTDEGGAFLENVRCRTKVYARADVKLRALKLYGPPGALRVARDMIKEELDRRAEEETTVVLDVRAISFFVQRGLSALQDLVGAENATLDVGKRIMTVRGGEEAKHHLTKLVQQSKDSQRSEPTTSGPGDEGKTCPVCYDDASSPEELVCGHVYCTGCLSHMVKEAKEFPLVCIGNDTGCRSPLSIPVIRRFVTLEAFQALVNAAFVAHIDENQDTYKYCPTPDCRQLYLVGVEGRVLTCPSCFRPTCTACGEEDHEGFSCREWSRHKDPQEQDRLFQESIQANGLMKCPSCSKWIQKSEGCNHMTCSCGAHFCWKCGRGFATGQEVYNHLQSDHGGYFDDAPQPQVQQPPPLPPPPLAGLAVDRNADVHRPRFLEGGGGVGQLEAVGDFLVGAWIPGVEEEDWDEFMQGQRAEMVRIERERAEDEVRRRARQWFRQPEQREAVDRAPLVQYPPLLPAPARPAVDRNAGVHRRRFPEIGGLFRQPIGDFLLGARIPGVEDNWDEFMRGQREDVVRIERQRQREDEARRARIVAFNQEAARRARAEREAERVRRREQQEVEGAGRERQEGEGEDGGWCVIM